MKNKVVFIVGPTGVGKTDLALSLATKLGGALISADSIQVYKGLDIVSGKDLSKTAQYFSLPQYNNGDNTGFYIDRGIPIFLLDVVEPSFPFSVSAFYNLANRATEYIQKQNKIPIVVGGTGLYIKALISGIDTAYIKPDPDLRLKLEIMNVEDLQQKLQSLNPKKLEIMNRSDRNNPRRLMRAIEISVQKTGDKRQETAESANKLESLVIGLECDKEVLKKRIEERVDARFEHGALEEATRFFTIYNNLAPQIKTANGYKQLFEFLQNKINYEEAIYRWKISEYRHAKNQMTWFQKYGNVEWFDINKNGFELDIERRVKNF